MFFPGSSDGKESACDVRDLGLHPGLGRSPGGGHDNPLQYSFLENPCGQRSLVGYSLWGHRQWDTTEWLSTEHIHRYWARPLSTLFLNLHLQVRCFCPVLQRRKLRISETYQFTQSHSARQWPNWDSNLDLFEPTFFLSCHFAFLHSINLTILYEESGPTID